MTDNQAEMNSESRPLSLPITLGLCGLLLVIGIGFSVLIFSTEPQAVREGASKQTAMLVETVEVSRGDYRPLIEVLGTVEPSKDIELGIRVGGEVLEMSPHFTPGGYVTQGEVLVQVDPSDYKNALEQRESALRQAVADLHLEMGRQEIAQEDYRLLEPELSPENESLVLREPQLNTARARVESARAAVAQAEKELERTTVRAPFDAHVLSRNVNLGSQLNPGMSLGRLVGLDTYWVAARVPLSKLTWLTIPENREEPGSRVILRNRTAWTGEQQREGQIFRLVGSVDQNTRLARLIVSVEDPLSRNLDSEQAPRLILGSVLEARIEGKLLSQVVRLRRDFVRSSDKTWVMEAGKLQIRDLDVVFQDKEFAYIRSGLEDGDQVVTTNLATVVEGAPLRTAAEESASMTAKRDGIDPQAGESL